MTISNIEIKGVLVALANGKTLSSEYGKVFVDGNFLTFLKVGETVPMQFDLAGLNEVGDSKNE